MKRPTQLFLLVLAVLLGGGALWYALNSGGTGSPDELAFSATPGSSKSFQEESQDELELQGGAAHVRSAADEEPTATAAGAEDLQENFELDGARWIDVRVAAPLGSPPDETLGVMLVAHREGGEFQGWAARQLRSGFRPRSMIKRVRSMESELAWALRTVDATGVARVPAPAKAQRATLFVDGRFLFMDEPHDVELDDAGEVVQLDPKLGAWVTGSFSLPHGADARGIAADALEGEVTLMSSDFMDGNNSWESFEVEDAGTFEFRGLRTGVKYLLAAGLEDLEPYMEMGLTFDPGEHRELSVTPKLGARITGRVLDEAGNGVEGARVDVDYQRPGMGMMMGSGDEDAQSDAQGNFVLLGVRAGKIEVDARKSGYRSAETLELEIAENDDVAGIELVLPTGESIAGRVLWPDGGPVEAASVTARSGRVVGTTETGADGTFALSGLEAGSFLVRAEKTPQPDPSSNYEVNPGWRGAQTAVAAGASDVTIRMVEPLTLAGFVRTRGGEPITKFKVTAKLVTEDPAGLASQSDLETEDENGAYLLGGLYPGEYDVTARAVGFQWPGDPLRITLPGVTEPLVLELAGMLTVSGRVVDPSGAPVAGAKVVARSEGGDGQQWMDFAQERGSGETDAEGRFELTNLQLGLVTVRARADGWARSDEVPVELVEGVEPPEIEVALHLGGRITGVVNDENGDPMVGQRVGYGSGMPMGAFAGGGDARGSVAKTDASGSFVFEAVPVGTWTVSAFPGGEDIMETMMTAEDETAFVDIMSKILTERVEVTEGGEVHVVLGPEPKRPVRVFGRVTASGVPYADSMIIALSEGNSLMQGLKMGRTDADGRYEFSVDRPGPYVLALGEGNSGPQLDYWIDVPDADEYELDIELPVGSISGRVVNTEGEPLGSIALGVTREDGGSTFAGFGDGQSTSTDTDGRYMISALKPGRYTVRAGINNPFAQSSRKLSVGVATGVAVEQDEATTGVDFRLPPAGEIEGVVKGPDGNPRADITIFARDGDGRLLQAMSSVITDAAGRFVHKVLPEGPVTLSARGESTAAADGPPINVSPGETREVEITLQDATLLIVSVVDKEGEPVRADVVVFDDHGRDVAGLFSSLRMESLFSEGLSTRERKFGPLPPGRYRVEAKTRDGRNAKKPVTLKGQGERKLKIRLRD